jgi:acyl-CoA dehydrogenase
VWATLDRSLGKAAIKSFVVDRDTPGFELVRLEHKLGIRASDTAHFRLDNCRVPAENLLGTPEIKPDQGFAGVMQTFDNTRPLVAAMAVGIARAALEETRRLLALQAAWMADNRKPNSVQASLSKAKAGRACVDIALRCVALTGATGYGEDSLLEKWARDSKILDLFEGTQQIQLLIIARQLLGLSSAQLK